MLFSIQLMALINDFLSLIYPRYCEACEGLLYKHERVICNKCALGLPKSNFHLNNKNPIVMALGGRVPLQNASSLFVFEKAGKVQNLLHALKYEKQQVIGELMGQTFYNDLKNSSFFEGIDHVVPIPLHKKKQRARGFNQSECFAKGISEKSGIPMDTQSFIRAIETSTQTKKGKAERWLNVKDAFAIKDPEVFKNKHILLVDDVITTGATIEGAWQALKTIEGIKISVATIAYADK
jgi:competence protein ComFC